MATKMVSLTQPTDYGAEAERIARQRRMAEILQQQSMEQGPAGQMVGGYFVPQSPLSGLAKMLQGWGASKRQAQLDEEQKALGAKRRTDMGEDMSALVRALRGASASSETIVDEQAAGGEGRTATINAPAVSPMDSLQSILPTLKTPEMQQSGFGLLQQQIAQQMKPPERVDLGDRIGLVKDGQIVGYLPKGATPDAVLKESGAQNRHATPSGSAILSEQGQNQRHLTPSGSARLQASTTLQTHATPSGSAILNAETTRRGQDQAVDPVIQGRVAEGRAAGTTRGEAAAQAQITLPAAQEKARQAVALIDQMIGTQGRQLQPGEKPTPAHPGFSSVVGGTLLPGARFVPGTDAAGFDALLEQVKGGAFLQAFESLKGGGAITQIEGEKATQAITRMQRAQSEAEFIRAAREFQENITKGMRLAERRAGYQGPERRGVPSGVDPAVWNAMTAEERALWSR